MSVALRILMEFPFSMRPRLASELKAAVGEGFDEAFDELIRAGELVAVYPESNPGDSGRQFWAVRGHEPPHKTSPHDGQTGTTGKGA